MNRCIDTYVLILVIKGRLYITMDNVDYTVCPGQFLVLFPNRRHIGTRPSEGPLSYYWMHYSLKDPDAQILDLALAQDISRTPSRNPVGSSTAASSSTHPVNSSDVPDVPLPSDPADTHYIIPATGQLYDNKKPAIIFQSLLDTARRDHYQVTRRTHYLASYLLLELLHDAAQRRNAESSRFSDAILIVLDYIQSHYAEPITTQSIAAVFGYHPVYLERLFKRELGRTITQYVNETRIEASQNLLVSSILPVESIAVSCGFSDPKYYMRVFRRQVNMTPSQYRRSLFRRYVNTR